MLVLFETPAGYALFTVKDNGNLLADGDALAREFASPQSAAKLVKLRAFSKFESTTEALAAATALIDGSLSKDLRRFLKSEVVANKLTDTLAVADSKLGIAIKEKLGIQCVASSIVDELFRGIRSQFNSLISGVAEAELAAMSLGLAHSLSRYKLKFSPDKVDTMIIQAIALLDDLDKELNTYAMRVKEWYGWHFPELTKIIVDNVAYAKVVRLMGVRQNASKAPLSEVLPEELETEVREVAEISMGTEISEEDISNIVFLCDQVISLSEYRVQLYDYLKNRMQAIAPNLTILVGDLVGARLISHAGSLLNLAKHPASTVQILGAEKALFRALKTKHNTPKYGLIYHASLIGQASPKFKGKISRVLAAKAALAIRVDALGDKDSQDVATESRAKVEARLRQLEGKQRSTLSGSGKVKTPTAKIATPKSTQAYSAASDATPSTSKKEKKRAAEEQDEETTPSVKKSKKSKRDADEE